MSMTNEEFIEKYCGTAPDVHRRKPFTTWDEIREAMNADLNTMRKEIADKAWEAGRQRGIEEEENDTDGHIEGSIDKSTFMKSLFP